jgi:hypothetical protein
LACAGIRRKCWYNRWYLPDTNIFDTNIRDTNMALTEMEIRNAKPGAKIIKLSDGGAKHFRHRSGSFRRRICTVEPFASVTHPRDENRGAALARIRASA